LTIFCASSAAFPVYLHVGPYVIHPHFFFEALSYVVAFTVYLLLRRRFGDSLATPPLLYM